jgi:hypothetical protein
VLKKVKPIGSSSGMPSQKKLLQETISNSISGGPKLTLVSSQPAPKEADDEVPDLTSEQRSRLIAKLEEASGVAEAVMPRQSSNDDGEDSKYEAWLAHCVPIPHNVCWLDVDGCDEIYRARMNESQKRKRDNVSRRTPPPAPVWMPDNPVLGWYGSRCPTVQELLNHAEFNNARLPWGSYQEIAAKRIARKISKANKRVVGTTTITCPTQEAANDTSLGSSEFVGPLPQATNQPPWGVCEDYEYTSWLITHSDKYWAPASPLDLSLYCLNPKITNPPREELDPVIKDLVRDDMSFRLNSDLTTTFGQDIENGNYRRWLYNTECLNTPRYTDEEKYSHWIDRVGLDEDVRYQGWLAINTTNQGRCLSETRQKALIKGVMGRFKAKKATIEQVKNVYRYLGRLNISQPTSTPATPSVSVETFGMALVDGESLRTHFVTTMDDVRKRAQRARKQRRAAMQAEELESAVEKVQTSSDQARVRYLSRLIVDEVAMGETVREEVREAIQEIIPTLNFNLKSIVIENMVSTVLGHLMPAVQIQIQRSVHEALKGRIEQEPSIKADSTPVGYVKDGAFYMPT